MKRRPRRLALALVLLLGVSLASAIPGAAISVAQAAALRSLKISYLATIDTLVFQHAEHGGFFKKEGLDVQALRVNDGPSVISAVVSGSAQIGFAATTPIVIAYEHGQKVAVFATGNYERYPYSANVTNIVASKSSGIKTLAGLKGKTVATNAQTSGCTITIEQHLARVGLTIHDVKLLVIPFPNMPAALALGETDAVCTLVPFLTAMQLNPKIAPVVLARGTLADLRKIHQIAVTSYFASSDWAKTHRAILKRFLVALQKSQDDLNAHPAFYHRDLVKYFHMKPAFAAKVPLALSTVSVVAKPGDYRDLFDALVKAGMLKKPVEAKRLITTITP